MSASCRLVSSEEPAVIPLEPTAEGLGTDLGEVIKSGIAQAALPTRDRRLLHAGDRSHFDLGDPEDVPPDAQHLIHTRKYIPYGIKVQPLKYQEVLGGAYSNRYISGMNVASILRALLAEGMTQEGLADALQTNQANVSRWLSGERVPMGDNMLRIRALAVRHGIPGVEAEARRAVPIMGFIGAGAEIDPDYEQVPPDGFDQVELPLALTDEVIGLQVRGDSMLPKYVDGAVVVVYREQTRSTTSLIGETAAVRTHEGKRYLKTLMAGPKPHTFNLESFNASPIIGVRIAWASEIIATIEPRQVRRKSKAQERKPKPTGGRESAPKQRRERQ